MTGKGLSLPEVLVVVALVGVLAVLLLANFLSAKQLAEERVALAHAQNVSKAAFAYVAKDPSRSVITTNDCTGGYTAGGYIAPSPGSSVSACTVSDSNNDGIPEVSVTSRLEKRGGVGEL